MQLSRSPTTSGSLRPQPMHHQVFQPSKRARDKEYGTKGMKGNALGLVILIPNFECLEKG
jgi:hypothetical protein